MISKEEYSRLVEEKSPKSPLLSNCVKAFLMGGIICTLGQGFINLYKALGIDEKTAGTLCSVSLIFIAAVLTATGLFTKIAKFAGAGILVPITGFSNSVVSPAIEFKSEGFILGIGARMFTIAGPVIVYGVTSSVIYGIIYFITTLFR